MAEQLTAMDVMRKIPFVVVALAETVTEPGSYKRALATAVAQSVKTDVEWRLAR